MNLGEYCTNFSLYDTENVDVIMIQPSVDSSLGENEDTSLDAEVRSFVSSCSSLLLSILSGDDTSSFTCAIICWWLLLLTSILLSHCCDWLLLKGGAVTIVSYSSSAIYTATSSGLLED